MSRRRPVFLLLSATLVAACASNPSADTDASFQASGSASFDQSNAQMIPVSAVNADGSPKVCVPEVVDERAPLDETCLNRIDGVPYSGKRYRPVGREVKELPSLCDQMFLPRCRRKY